MDLEAWSTSFFTVIFFYYGFTFTILGLRCVARDTSSCVDVQLQNDDRGVNSNELERCFSTVVGARREVSDFK